ncbi:MULTISPECIES: UDP-N-acetylmuramoyl-tripeptide--D-alanyl-D-alanine ligase [unclassified Nocardioides]|uniref:UDP-N-acetylmuramoyl-tripeptide--D-alanyl-D- alanine ligase n=1 Tax=unclassified Nocardioides TaxID=2615069 RepID=UPI0009E78801|nr:MULTISPECIES: UDP-N-acetylmuramoyl-tripeptide--D-alanyl-D-alanine ligase [unclassified Nocardioides]
MIALTLAQIAEAVDGEVAGDPAVVVSAPAFLDSRQVEPGGLFVAVVGERVDGHDYAAGAVAAGAAAVLGSRATDVPTVVVADPVVALGRLARHVLDALPGLTVLAMTGSQGKTGTKDYLAQVLAAAGPTVATLGNLNNELGVPLTALRATTDTRFLVVEMGARGIGHITYLCDVAPPTIAAVLNVGTAHVGEFGSREAIAVAKGEILEALPADGVAVINADDELTSVMGPRTAARVVRFGLSGAPDVTWHDTTYDDLDRASAVLEIAGERHPVTLRQTGEHQLHNAAAAAAMAHAAGLSAVDIATGLSAATSLSPWRMELHELPDGPVVVNDAYNANPASMRAAISALLAIAGRRGGRSIAVLGEMRELGAGAEADHRDLGEHAARAGVDVLLVVGEGARAVLEGAANVTPGPSAALYVADRAAALAWLRENMVADDVVLVKASRGAALEWIAQQLGPRVTRRSSPDQPGQDTGPEPEHVEEKQE